MTTPARVLTQHEPHGPLEFAAVTLPLTRSEASGEKKPTLPLEVTVPAIVCGDDPPRILATLSPPRKSNTSSLPRKRHCVST